MKLQTSKIFIFNNSGTSSQTYSLLKDKAHLHPLLSDFEEVSKNPHSAFPYKYMVYGGNHWETLVAVVKPRGFQIIPIKEDDHLDNMDLIWKPIQFSNKVFDLYIIFSQYYQNIDKINSNRDKRRHIVINHLENIKGICTKTGLIKSLRRFYKFAADAVTAQYSVHHTTPTTFVVLPDCNDAEYIAFVQRFQDLEKGNYKREKVPAKHCEGNVWLIKPAAENQGRGMETKI